MDEFFADAGNRMEKAVEAVKLGAVEFLEKPFFRSSFSAASGAYLYQPSPKAFSMYSGSSGKT